MASYLIEGKVKAVETDSIVLESGVKITVRHKVSGANLAEAMAEATEGRILYLSPVGARKRKISARSVWLWTDVADKPQIMGYVQVWRVLMGQIID